MTDKLALYLQELQAFRDSERQPLDDFLVKLHMRNFKFQRTIKPKK